MLFQKKEKYYFFYLLFFTPILMGHSDSIDKALGLFISYKSAGVINSENSIEAIFNACEINKITSSKDIVKQIVIARKKISTRSQRSNIELIKKRKKLKQFRLHVRKYRYLYDFLAFAQILKRRYKHAFNNSYIVEDVYKSPDLYDYSPKRGDNLVRFFKLLQADLGAISRFETKLHSRYCNLKCLNYSFKIECIKVRNEILFHPWYRHRLRDGYELLTDAFGPLTFLGKVALHVVPSVVCIIAFTLSTSL